MSGSEHSNSPSPRYCPTPHQIPHPVPSSPPPPQMMHQVHPGHTAQGHGHHMQPAQQMSYYGYHSTPAPPQVHHQQPPSYYGTQNPSTGYYHPHPPPSPSPLHHPPPPPSPHHHLPPHHQPPPHTPHPPPPQHHPQNGYGQSVPWQGHQTYYGHYNQPPGQYAPPPQPQQQQQQQQQQQPPAQRPPPQQPQSTLTHQHQQQQQQQHPRPGNSNVNYERPSMGHNMPPQQPSTHPRSQQREHVGPSCESSGQHALMNLSRFVNQNQSSLTNTENNKGPGPDLAPRSQTPLNTESGRSSVTQEIRSPSRPSASSNTLTTATTTLPRPSPQSLGSAAAATATPATTTPVVSPASSVISTSGGGQGGMMPVRLQNSRGARTKASMRKMLMEQTAEPSKPEPAETPEEPPAKRARRKPKATEEDNEAPAPATASSEKSPDKKKSTPKSEAKSKSKSTPRAKKKQTVSPPAKSAAKVNLAPSPPATPKKRGRKTKSDVVNTPPDPSTSVASSSSNNVEEEIAKVLLDLKTGKSSPEKSTGESSKVVEELKEEPKKRQRRSSVRSSSTATAPSEDVIISPKPKGKKGAAVKTAAKAKPKAPKKSGRGSSDSSAVKTPKTPKTPKGKKSKTIVTQSEEPVVSTVSALPSSSGVLLSSDEAEQEFPVIHIPEVPSETVIVVQSGSSEPMTLTAAELDFGFSLEPSKIAPPPPPVAASTSNNMNVVPEEASNKPKRGGKKPKKSVADAPAAKEPRKKKTPTKKEKQQKKSEEASSPVEELPDLEPLDFGPLVPSPPKKTPKKEKKTPEAKPKKSKGSKKAAAHQQQPPPPPPSDAQSPEPDNFPVLSIAEDTGKATIFIPSSASSTPVVKTEAKKATKSKAKSPKLASPKVKTPKKSKKSKASEPVTSSEEPTASTPQAEEATPIKATPVIPEKGKKKRKRSETPVGKQRQASRKKKSKLEQANEEAIPVTTVSSADLASPSADLKLESAVTVDEVTTPTVDVAGNQSSSIEPKSKKASKRKISPKSKAVKATVESAKPSELPKATTPGKSPKSAKGSKKRKSKQAELQTGLIEEQAVSAGEVSETVPAPNIKAKMRKSRTPERAAKGFKKAAEKAAKPSATRPETRATPERGRKKASADTTEVPEARPSGRAGKSPKRAESPKKEKLVTPKPAAERVRGNRRSSTKSQGGVNNTEVMEVVAVEVLKPVEAPKEQVATAEPAKTQPTKTPDAAKSKDSSPVTVPPKKRYSKYDRATLDALENETIMEVSMAADDPLPPLEFYYQFEYTQRNNYPPSMPPPGKRKHAQLEARKHELLNELSQLSSSKEDIKLPEQPVQPAIQEPTVIMAQNKPSVSVVKADENRKVSTPVVATTTVERKITEEPRPAVVIEKQVSPPVETENIVAAPADKEPSPPGVSFIPAKAKPIKAPSVFVKSAPLGSSNIRASGSAGDMDAGGKKSKGAKQKKGAVENGTRHKTSKDAPSLRVERGQVKFYRGGEEEDVEPPATKLRSERPTDSFDSKVPWLCTFCKLGPHACRLGDLFGPYYVNVARENHEEVTKETFAPSGSGDRKLESQKRETWMHQDCALWAGELLLIGTSIRGLDKAVYDAEAVACTICGKKGATIGCLTRKCGQAAHFPCAQKMQWELDDETFLSYCSIHSCKTPSLL